MGSGVTPVVHRMILLCTLCILISSVQGECTYTIVSGDTFSHLEIANGWPSGSVAQLNPGVDPTNLQVGQVINVPCAAPTTGACTYVIKPGDTFWAISIQLGTSLDSVLQLNPGVEPTLLQIGQVVNIPCTPQQPPLETVDCSKNCTVYCSKTQQSPINGTCAQVAAAVGLATGALARLNPNIPCAAQPNAQLFVAGIIGVCTDGQVIPVADDLLSAQNPARRTQLNNVAQKAAELNPALAAKAAAFIKDPESDPFTLDGFTRSFALSLAANATFAALVAADQELSTTVLKTLPGNSIPALCDELVKGAAGSGQGSGVYQCFCQRTTSSPPLVTCWGILANMTIGALESLQAANITVINATAVGRKLKTLLSPHIMRGPQGDGSSRRQGRLHNTSNLALQARQQSMLSNRRKLAEVEKETDFKAGCSGVEAEASLKSTKAKEGEDPLASCKIALTVPQFMTDLCSGNVDNLQATGDTAAAIMSGSAQPDAIKALLEEDDFGFEVSDCCLNFELVSICMAAELKMPAYFALAEESSYLVCNKIGGAVTKLVDGVKVPLAPDSCLDLWFASTEVLETMANSRTGHLEIKVCLADKIMEGLDLPFEPPCWTVVDASYYGFQGHFILGSSLTVLMFRGSIDWVFQVHEPWERICRDPDLAQNRDYCCMCKGENWGYGHFQVWAGLLGHVSTKISDYFEFWKWKQLAEDFTTFEDVPGSPWTIKAPPNCQARWDNHDTCSKRSAIEANPLPASPEKHAFKVNAVYTTDWAQWRTSNNSRPTWCDPYATSPKDINPKLYTHVFFAFAQVDPTTFAVKAVEANDSKLISEIPIAKPPGALDLLDLASGLFLTHLISIGGWSFSRSEGAFLGKNTKTIFPTMASTAANRAKFIDSAIAYAKQYGFRGIDIDWEYPNFDNTSSTERTDFTQLLREMYPKCQQAGLLLTAAVRAFNGEQHYEMSEIHKYLDWLNVMAYDFYGPGFGQPIAKLNAPMVDCHSKACDKPFDIQTGLSQYISAGVPPDKLVLGLATYGRSFELKTPVGSTSVPAPGSATTVGPGYWGDCTNDTVGGVLAYYEIKHLKVEPIIDGPGMGAYGVYGPNKEYWVGFDTPDTLKSKVCWAAAMRLGGTFAWDSNMDDNSELQAAVFDAWTTPRTCPVVMPEQCPPRPQPDLPCSSAPSYGPADCTKTHKVISGDTCWKIWTDAGLTQEQFLALNSGLDCNLLAVESTVCLQSSTNTSVAPVINGCTKNHTVVSGDTCWQIWTDAGLTQEQFTTLNPSVDCNALAIGSRVCLNSNSPGSNSFVVKHVMGGKCLHPASGSATPAIGEVAQLKDGCDLSPESAFHVTPTGALQHVNSGLCLRPDRGLPNEGQWIVFSDKCDDYKAHFEGTAGGSIRQVATGFCLHPDGGANYPVDGTRLVLANSCDVARIQFATLLTAPTPSTGPATPTVLKSSTAPTQVSADGDCLVSASKLYYLCLEGGGNMVLYRIDFRVWTSNTGSAGPARNLVMQTDGKLVAYASSGAVIWSSGTPSGSGSGPYTATVGDNGNIVVTDSGGSTVWASGILQLGNTFYLQHAMSGKCLHPASGSPLPVAGEDAHLWTGCQLGPKLAFRVTAVGYLQHVNSGLCLRPVGGGLAIETHMVLSDQCDSVARFEGTPGSSIRHVATGFCLHPYGGANIPDDGTRLVFAGSCDLDRIKFNPALPVLAPVSPNSPAPVPAPVMNGCTKTHTVISGDTCWQIWTNAGLTQQQFTTLNPSVDCSALAIGSTVCINSSSISGTSCAKPYTVVQGDYCYQIWTSNNLTQDSFMALNPGLDCTALVIGRVVCVG